MAFSLEISPKSKLYRRLIDAVRDRVTSSKGEMEKFHKRWKEAEERSIAYIPEREMDALRRAEREGGKPQYTTIQLPYTYAVMLSAHTYWTSVFLSRNPIFQFTGRHGETEQQTQALEALIDYQVNVGDMLPVLHIWLYDVAKYGFGVIGIYWDEEISTVVELREEPVTIFGIPITGSDLKPKMKKVRVSKEVRGYIGNRIYNVSPFDFFPDPRIPIHRLQEGEFCAVRINAAWNEIRQRAEEGEYINIDLIRQVKHGDTATQPSALERPDPLSFSPNEKNNKGTVELYECYLEIVPSDIGLTESKKLEKWVFTVTSDFSALIGARPLGEYHNKFPFAILQLEPEGHALVGRGMPEILKPVQDTIDWLINSHFYNVRKALNDMFIVDPSRIILQDLLDPRPGGVVRLSPAAFGDPNAIDRAIRQMPVVDVTRAHIGDLQMMLQFGERVSGVNDQVMGLFPVGGRRSATEIRASSSFAVNRLKTISEFFSALGFAPLAEILVQSSQQHYDQAMKLRVVGDLAQQAGQRFLEVSPDMIQGFFDFVPVDGTLPVDRFAQANLWRELLGQLRNFPQLMQQYDIGKIFAWVAQLSGLKNINQFKLDVQVLPDQVLEQQAQAGNVAKIDPNRIQSAGSPAGGLLG